MKDFIENIIFMYKNILNIFKNIKYGIKNLIKWFPIIYKDRDFDYFYLLNILYFKLSNMEKFFKNDNLCMSKDHKIYGDEIAEILPVLKRLMEENYILEHNFIDESSIKEINDTYKKDAELVFDTIKNKYNNWWD